MEVTIKYINEHEVELSISSPWENVQGDYTDLLKRYAKVPVKGFRPGSVSQSTIEKIFKKEIQSDLASVCTQRLCRKALADNQLQTGSPISITGIEMLPGEQFAFKANFLKMPEFELSDYSKLNLHSGNHEDRLTEISEKLLQHVSFDLYKDFVDQELKFSDLEESVTDEVAWKAAEDRVKLMLILKKIAGINNIEVDEQDVNTRIGELAQANEVTPKDLKEYLSETGGLGRLREYLLAEQVLAYLSEINE